MVVFVLLLFGIIIGSFINALVWRLHYNSSHKKKLSIVNGRSICPNCGHKLAILDLIPLFSWLFLGGKCRYCKKPISIQYPIVELLTGVLFVCSKLFWNYGFDTYGKLLFIIWSVILVILIVLTIYDIRWKLLPNILVSPLIILSTVFIFILYLAGNNILILTSAVWGIVVVFGLFYILFATSSGKWIGGGDVKLAVAIGLLVGGPAASILMIFLASLFGSLYSLPLIIVSGKKVNQKIPFGPFLIISTYICFFFSEQILVWYQRFYT